jgi:hypothetical protein
MTTEKHICQESHSCCCSLTALEPDEDCPVHAAGPWPPRCEVCGHFMPYKAKWDANMEELRLRAEQANLEVVL